jgi:hypothetical protein
VRDDRRECGTIDAYSDGEVVKGGAKKRITMWGVSVVNCMSGEANDDGRTDDGVTQPNQEDPGQRPMLKGTVVRYDDEPDECTLHPSEPTEFERTTAWITAKEGSYVSATTWR